MQQESLKEKLKIGFIGQGFIGANYALDYENRGYKVIRYARDEKFAGNKDLIKNCDITFIAVPTPTTPTGFDDGTLQEVLALIGPGKIAVIKSTILPGTTEKFQHLFPDICVLHSPEFLTEATATYDAAHPQRNIIGYVDAGHYQSAELVMNTLPLATYKAIVPAKVAELIKYGGNCWFYFKVIYMNLLYDLCKQLGIDYELVKQGMSYDPRIGHSHLDVVHQGGRGAGGHCFIKDFAAFSKLYAEELPEDTLGATVLSSLEQKNIKLLLESNKNLDLLTGVYGDKILEDIKKHIESNHANPN